MEEVAQSANEACATHADCRAIVDPALSNELPTAVVHRKHADELGKTAERHISSCGNLYPGEEGSTITVVEPRCVEHRCEGHRSVLHVEEDARED